MNLYKTANEANKPISDTDNGSLETRSPEAWGEKTIHVLNNYARYNSVLDLVSLNTSDDKPDALTKNEFLVLMYIFAHIKRDDEEFNPICVSLRKMCSDFGVTLSGSTDYKQWRSTIAKLFDRKISFVVTKGVVQTEHYFTGRTEDFNNNTIEFRLNPVLRAFLLNLDDFKTIFKFGYFRQLGSTAAMMLYILCSSMKHGGHSFCMDVEHLKNQLGYTGRAGDFISRILVPVAYEVNHITDITVMFEPVYSAGSARNKITTIRFIVHQKYPALMESMGISPQKLRADKVKASITEMRKEVVGKDIKTEKDDIWIKEMSLTKLFRLSNACHQ